MNERVIFGKADAWSIEVGTDLLWEEKIPSFQEEQAREERRGSCRTWQRTLNFHLMTLVFFF